MLLFPGSKKRYGPFFFIFCWYGTGMSEKQVSKKNRLFLNWYPIPFLSTTDKGGRVFQNKNEDRAHAKNSHPELTKIYQYIAYVTISFIQFKKPICVFEICFFHLDHEKTGLQPLNMPVLYIIWFTNILDIWKTFHLKPWPLMYFSVLLLRSCINLIIFIWGKGITLLNNFSKYYTSKIKPLSSSWYAEAWHGHK